MSPPSSATSWLGPSSGFSPDSWFRVRTPCRIVGTIVLGIVGAVIGGWAAGAIFEDTTGVDWIASIIAAVLLVLVWRAIAATESGASARRMNSDLS